jgi:hypothetical protein
MKSTVSHIRLNFLEPVNAESKRRDLTLAAMKDASANLGCLIHHGNPSFREENRAIQTPKDSIQPQKLEIGARSLRLRLRKPGFRPGSPRVRRQSEPFALGSATFGTGNPSSAAEPCDSSLDGLVSPPEFHAFRSEPGIPLLNRSFRDWNSGVRRFNKVLGLQNKAATAPPRPSSARGRPPRRPGRRSAR